MINLIFWDGRNVNWSATTVNVQKKKCDIFHINRRFSISPVLNFLLISRILSSIQLSHNPVIYGLQFNAFASTQQQDLRYILHSGLQPLSHQLITGLPGMEILQELRLSNFETC